MPRQAQGAPLCGKGPAPGTAREGASGAGRAPCMGKAPAPAGAVQKKPLPHPAHLQISPHVSRPACYGGLFILRLLRRGNPSAPPPGVLWAAAFFPYAAAERNRRPCAQESPRASRGCAEKALASSGTSYRQAPMSAARPAMGAFFILHLLRRGNPSAPPPGGLWAAAFFPHTAAERNRAPVRGKAPPAGAVQKKPLPHPAHHTDKPLMSAARPAIGAFFIFRLLRRGNLPPHRRAVYGAAAFFPHTAAERNRAPVRAKPPCSKGPVPGAAHEGASGAGRAPCIWESPGGHALRQSAPHRWGSFSTARIIHFAHICLHIHRIIV